jgi:hypothetical protein
MASEGGMVFVAASGQLQWQPCTTACSAALHLPSLLQQLQSCKVAAGPLKCQGMRCWLLLLFRKAWYSCKRPSRQKCSQTLCKVHKRMMELGEAIPNSNCRTTACERYCCPHSRITAALAVTFVTLLATLSCISRFLQSFI